MQRSFAQAQNFPNDPSDPEIFSLIKAAPKVELHAHLNASITREKFFELMERESIPYDPAKLNPKNMKNVFGEVFPLLNRAIQSRRQLEFVCKSAFQGFVDDNVMYLEIRSTPKRLSDISEIDYVNLVIDQIEQFAGRIEIRFLISQNRAMPPEFYDQFLTELARNPKWQKYLVGFDYSGTPYQRFITDYTEQIQKGKDLGLGLTVHTAEIPDQCKETAPIFALGPTRVGHFNYFTEKELDHQYENDILVEVCPTSNMVTMEFDDLAEHHQKKFVERGVKMSICTDDVLQFEKNLSEEIWGVWDTFGYGVGFLEQMTQDAIDKSFAKEDRVKQQLTARLETFYDRLRV